jgi:hypothetical protein
VGKRRSLPDIAGEIFTHLKITLVFQQVMKNQYLKTTLIYCRSLKWLTARVSKGLQQVLAG